MLGFHHDSKVSIVMKNITYKNTKIILELRISSLDSRVKTTI